MNEDYFKKMAGSMRQVFRKMRKGSNDSTEIANSDLYYYANAALERLSERGQHT